MTVSATMKPARAATYNRTVRAGRSTMEYKNLDIGSVNIPNTTVQTGAVTLLNGCAQGTTATTRIGRMIKMTSLYFKLVFCVSSTSVLAEAIRVLVVYDKQPNGAALTAANVMEVDTLTSPVNLGNQRRFKILYDQTKACIGTAGPQNVVFAVKAKKLNKLVEFNTGSTGNIGDIQTGSLYMIVYKTGTLATTNETVAFYSRVLFSDN